MHSPLLPDSSALEAGILEDTRPSRISRVQDNVRNLLRAGSNFNSVHSSPQVSPTHNHHNHHLQYQQNHGILTPPESPIGASNPPHQPEAPPNAHAETPTPTSSSTSSAQAAETVTGILFPPASYRATVQQMAHQSALFNARAVAALNLSENTSEGSLPLLLVQGKNSNGRERRKVWKRSRTGSGRRREVERLGVGGSGVVLCVLAALLLSAIVATYLILATSSNDNGPAFHILFILGILLATIVFAHTLIRLILFSGNNTRTRRKIFIMAAGRAKHHHHHHRRVHRDRAPPQPIHIMPALSSDDPTDFVPPTPIRVHMPADEVRPDTREAEPTATIQLPPSAPEWDKDIDSIPNPPPAYGRWRGSVRANPDLLHWQAVPSPVDSLNTPADLPSPTYEEATQAERTGPPSYVTRDSPARRRVVREGGDVDVRAQQARVSEVPEQLEAEMIEVRALGLGV